MNIQRDLTEIINYFEWAVGLVVLLPEADRAIFVTELGTVATMFLTAIRKVSISTLLFGGDPFKLARLRAREFQTKWNGGLIT